MRNLAVFGATIVLAACQEVQPALFEISYDKGRFEALEIGPSGDFKGSDEDVVPQLIRECKGRFLALRYGITDGGGGAYFEAGSEPNKVRECIRARFPHSFVNPVERTAQVEKDIAFYRSVFPQRLRRSSP